MLAAIITLASVAYGSAGVFAARKTFGWIRAKYIAQYQLDWTAGYRGQDNVLSAFFGTLGAIPLWPLYLVIFLIVASPPKTPKELKAENERLRRELEQMEKDAGLGPR